MAFQSPEQPPLSPRGAQAELAQPQPAVTELPGPAFPVLPGTGGFPVIAGVWTHTVCVCQCRHPVED